MNPAFISYFDYHSFASLLLYRFLIGAQFPAHPEERHHSCDNIFDFFQSRTQTGYTRTCYLDVRAANSKAYWVEISTQHYFIGKKLKAQEHTCNNLNRKQCHTHHQRINSNLDKVHELEMLLRHESKFLCVNILTKDPQNSLFSVALANISLRSTNSGA